MVDTLRGDFPEKKCSDCGILGCDFKHWGSMVPKGKEGYFCWFCWNERVDGKTKTKTVKPLGAKPPGVSEEFLNKAITVITETGSVYKFGLPDKKGMRTVSHNEEELEFERCDILCLIVGRRIYFRPHDFRKGHPYFNTWVSSPVVSIRA